MPERGESALTDLDLALANLARLAEIIELPQPPPSPRALAFWTASDKATIRFEGRRVRFLRFHEALLPTPIRL
jgi:hypothetical protein